MRVILLSFVVICALAHQALGYCSLTGRDVNSTTRIFTYFNGTNYVLQRNDVVDYGKVLSMVCLPSNIKLVHCDAYGRFVPPLPLTDCKPMNATVKIIKDNSIKCSGKLYSVGYQLKKDFLEIYRSCYDPKKVNAYYTIHDVYANTLQIKRTPLNYTTDNIITPNDANSFNPSNIYYQFENTFKGQQNYVQSDKDVVIQRTSLTPAIDFLFTDNVNSTFKYVNVVPQFAQINAGNWLSIENWVRNESLRYPRTPLRVCQGTLEILKLHNRKGKEESIYLGPSKKNPVPKWLYKTVKSDFNTTVFLTYNNIYDSKKPKPKCTSVACPSTIKLKDDKRAGYTFCCKPDKFFDKEASAIKKACYTYNRPRV